jgi:hypothetical protein
MRRWFLLGALSLLLCSTISSQGWDSLYASRLDASANYLEAVLALKTAQVGYDQHTKPLLPTIALTASANLTSGSFVPSLSFENVFGADIALKAPIQVLSPGGLTMGDPSLSISRNIFDETRADRLDAEAALLSAMAAVKSAQDSVRISLATEILNAMYYESLLSANRENLRVLEKVRDSTVNTSLQRELERRVLGAQKSVLVASNALENLDREIIDSAHDVYQEVLSLQTMWTAAIDSQKPGISLRIRSLEKSLEAAEKRKAFAILPYLPNPLLSTSLAYDISAQKLDFGLAISISYSALSKGRNSLAAYRREEYPRLWAMKASDAKKAREDGIRKIRGTLAILELDKRLNDLDISDAEEDVHLLERLYNAGYATEEDYVIARIDLSVELLEGRKIDFDILIQKLNLANYYEGE